MSYNKKENNDIWRTIQEGDDQAGWYRKSKGDMWVDRNGNETSPYKPERFDVKLFGVGLVNKAGNLPSQATTKYYKACYDYTMFLEDSRTIKDLRDKHPSIAKGSETNFKSQLLELRAKKNEINPYDKEKKGNWTINQLEENKLAFNDYKDHINAMECKQRGLFGNASVQATAEEELQISTQESIAEIKNQDTKLEDGR